MSQLRLVNKLKYSRPYAVPMFEEGGMHGVFDDSLQFLSGMQDKELNPTANWWDAPTNLLLQSENMATTWILNAVTVTVNVAADPVTGNQTVDRLTFAELYSFLQQSITVVAGEVYTIQFWLKRESGNTTLAIWDDTLNTPIASVDASSSEWVLHTYNWTPSTSGARNVNIIQDRNAAGPYGAVLIARMQVLPGTLTAAEAAAAYEKTTNRQRIYDYSGKGNHLTRGSTTGVDTNDPALVATYDGDLIWLQDGVDDYWSGEQARTGDWTVFEISGWPTWTLFGLDSTGQGWRDGAADSQATVPLLSSGTGRRTLRLYAHYNRVLSAAEWTALKNHLWLKLGLVDPAANELVFGHYSTTTANMRLDWTGGGVATIDWGAGAAPSNMTSGVASSKADYSSGSLHEIVMTVPNAATVMGIGVDTSGLVGTVPDLSEFTGLIWAYGGFNQLTGSVPDISANTALQAFHFEYNQLSGITPNVSSNVELRSFYLNSNQLTGYSGGADAQANWITFNVSYNALTATAINAILADLVIMQVATGDISAAVDLSGGTNAAPTGQGLTDKAALIAAGWTVTTN